MNEVILGVVLLTTIILGLTLTVISARAALMPSRDVTIEVNKSKKIKARTGLKLLSFLNDNDILVPSACAGAGTCGLCRVKITTGGSEALPTESAKLTNRELAEGLHLACQVVVRGDMNVVVSDDQLGAERWKCKVHTTRYLTPLIKEITFDDPPDTDLELAAGSFVQVTAPAFDLAFNELDIPPEHQKIWQQLTTLKVVAETPVTPAYSVSNVPADKGVYRAQCSPGAATTAHGGCFARHCVILFVWPSRGRQCRVIRSIWQLCRAGHRSRDGIYRGRGWHGAPASHDFRSAPDPKDEPEDQLLVWCKEP